MTKRACQSCGKTNPAEVTLCPECKKPVIDPRLWAAGWREAVARPMLPASWPAEAGLPRPGARCTGCGRSRWWRRGDGIVCGTCHPPAGGAVEWIEAGATMGETA